MSVWVAKSARKIRPFMHAEAGSSAQLQSARNAFVAFHLCIDGPVTGVEVTSDMPAPMSVMLYREELYNVTQQTGGDGATGLWPDELRPAVDYFFNETRNAFPFDVASNETRAVYVEIFVPESVAAGQYNGKVSVKQNGVWSDVAISLNVWPITLPSTSSLRSAYGMNWDTSSAHGLSGANWEQQLTLHDRYLRAALENRVSVYNPAGMFWNAATQPWDTFDAHCGQFFSGTGGIRLKGAKINSVKPEGDWSNDNVIHYRDHFASKGWTGLFAYVTDEPPSQLSWADTKSRIASLKAAAPTVPRLITTQIDEAFDHGINEINYYCPVVDHLHNSNGNFRSSYPDKDVWWYQSCDSWGCGYPSSVKGWPTIAIDADATRHMAMAWLAYAYDIDGDLFWEMIARLGNANLFNFGGNGDGTLFYVGSPARIGGTTHIPVESLRLKLIRDAYQDNELMRMAGAKVGKAQVQALVRTVFADTMHATASPIAIDTARAQLATWITAGATQPVPQPTPTPTPVPTPVPTPTPMPAPGGSGVRPFKVGRIRRFLGRCFRIVFGL